MSVSSRILVGLTIEFARDLKHADFAKVHEFENKYPELDEYNYDYKEREGKLLLVSDGMSGEFARLIQIDKYIDGGNMGDSNEFMELVPPNRVFNQELIDKMSKLYEEFTGKPATLADFKYAMWSQWG